MSEMYSRQPGFAYSDCGPFTKQKERTQKLKKQKIYKIFIKTKYIKFVFPMTWLMEFSKI